MTLHNHYAKIPYANESQTYHEYNVWPTRRLTRQMHFADCKAIVIAEYFDLLEKGLVDNQMYMIAVKIKKNALLHMILLVNNKYVLDIRHKKLITINQLNEYKPIYIMNRNGWSEITVFDQLK